MRMNWFKVYNDARNDAKLRTLTDTQFRVWFNLLCLASEQTERGVICDYDLDLLAIEVAGGDDDLLRSTVKQLVRLRIVCDDGTDLSFIHFLERQYDKASDYPEATAERKRRQRARDNLSDKHDVTPSHALSRIEEIREEEIRVDKSREDVSGAIAPRAQLAAAFWEAYPARNGKKLNKAQAMEGLKHIRDQDWPALMVAVGNYAESGQGPMDAFRFLQADRWREWLQPAATKFGRRPSKAAESAAFLTDVIKAAERGNNERGHNGTDEDSGEVLGLLDIGKWPTG